MAAYADFNDQSWIAAANKEVCHFSLKNLPFGIFNTGDRPLRRVGVAIGDQILDLAVLEEVGFLTAVQGARVFNQPSLNAFMALGPEAWSETRGRVSALLRNTASALRDDAALRANAIVPMSSATLHCPVEICGYTDFYASKEHATNVGSMFRDPKNALLPNWLHIPIGYNGRTSTVVVSGTPIRRPLGQIKLPGADTPALAPSGKLDFEIEIGAIVGVPSAMGEFLSIEQAKRSIFGYVLLNDWSARDIQQWEYVPLGPFQAKIFATSISPWVVTAEALLPYAAHFPIVPTALASLLKAPQLPRHTHENGRASIEGKVK